MDVGWLQAQHEIAADASDAGERRVVDFDFAVQGYSSRRLTILE
jgi:hypothetical protein